VAVAQVLLVERPARVVQAAAERERRTTPPGEVEPQTLAAAVAAAVSHPATVAQVATAAAVSSLSGCACEHL
jgi:hypothetical protein